MTLLKHFGTTDRQTALSCMRKHNKENPENKIFLLKEKVSICFASESKNGFILTSIKY